MMFSEIHAICFTEKGFSLCNALKASFPEVMIEKCFGEKKIDRLEWCEKHFKQGNLLLFVGAMGICVRTIAPFAKNKITDAAVLCIDELGHFVISVLSGHIGGANKAAEEIADFLGATAVITTATDVNGKQAIDVWATEHNFTISNPSAIKSVNAKILKNEQITKSDIESLGLKVFSAKKNVIAGVGCRKGASSESVIKAVECALRANSIDKKDLCAIASIDIKKEELGIIECAKYFDVPFFTFRADELNAVSGSISKSEFVEKTVGVDCVCERAALCAAKVITQKNGNLISLKQKYDSVTVALSDIK